MYMHTYFDWQIHGCQSYWKALQKSWSGYPVISTIHWIPLWLAQPKELTSVIYTQLSLSMFWGIWWNVFKVPAKEQQKPNRMTDIYFALFSCSPHPVLCRFHILNLNAGCFLYHTTLTRSHVCYFMDNLSKWHDRKVCFFCFILSLLHT